MLGREHNYRLAQSHLPHLAAKIKTGTIWQADIEQNQVRGAAAGVFHAAGAGDAKMGRESMLFEACRQAFANRRVIFNEENVV